MRRYRRQYRYSGAFVERINENERATVESLADRVQCTKELVPRPLRAHQLLDLRPGLRGRMKLLAQKQHDRALFCALMFGCSAE